MHKGDAGTDLICKIPKGAGIIHPYKNQLPSHSSHDQIEGEGER